MGLNSARISLAIAALLVVLPFLFPEHRPPLPSFYDEWLAVSLATLAVTAFVLARRSGKGAVPDLAVWLVLFSGWLALQAALREPAYPQLPIAGIAYVLVAAQLAWLGHALAERFGAERVVDVLAWAILVGATANAAIGITQFYGVPDALIGFVGTTSGPRIVGHVGQANLFADYLALGQASLLYLLARNRLRGVWCWIAASLLVMAGAYAQSRSAILFSLWLYVLALCVRGHGPLWQRIARHAGMLSLATLAAMVAIPLLHHAIGFQSPMFALERLVDYETIRTEPRPAAWALAWRLFVDAPWLGVGWGEFAGAAFRAGLPPALGVQDAVWTSPHNVLLQLLAESGLVGAALILLASLRWWSKTWTDLRGAATLPLWWIASVVGTISLHALLEQPLWYAHVLALAALVAGVASPTALKLSAVPVRVCLLAANVLASIVLAWTFFDFQRFDRAYVVASGRTLAPAGEVSAAVAELQAAGDGPLGAQVAPWLYVSLPLPSENPTVALAMGERALRRWPAPQIIARHAATLALAGQQARATQIMQHAWDTLPAGRWRLESAPERLRSSSAR